MAAHGGAGGGRYNIFLAGVCCEAHGIVFCRDGKDSSLDSSIGYLTARARGFNVPHLTLTHFSELADVNEVHHRPRESQSSSSFLFFHSPAQLRRLRSGFRLDSSCR